MKNSELHFISRLSDYSLRSILIRLSLVSATGFLLLLFSVKIAGEPEVHITAIHYLQVVFIFNIISEINVLLDHLGERFFPIPEKIKWRVVIHFTVSIMLAIAAVGYFFLVLRDAMSLSQPVVQLMLLFGMIFIFNLILVSVALRIIEKWMYSVKQLEELQSSKLKSDYNSLQAQLNPHFLFNNLSVLKSMITYNPESAVRFTQNFTDVYRYVLRSREKTTVKLAEELEFIEAYAEIHKERLGEAFILNINVPAAVRKKEIPPLALQLLVENAVKHNIAVMEEPLVIHIMCHHNMLVVTNNLNPKESGHSEQTGLKNLVNRYRLLTEAQVTITRADNKFEVGIPLL